MNTKPLTRCLLVLALAASVAAQSVNPYRPMLGEGSAAVERRTRLGVRYVDNGFSRPKLKKAAKTIEWLKRRNQRPDLVAEFGRFAVEAGQPDYIPSATDRAFAARKSAWLACTCADGKHRKIAERVRPDSILVVVESRPFYIAQARRYTNGATMNAGLIRVVICYVNNLSDPKAAWLTTFERLVEHETGNLFGIRGGYRPTTVENEIGAKSPCGIF